MKRILFVRHGSTDSNATGVMRGWSDDPLSDLGRRQVTAAAQYVATLAPIECIYTSTLPRAIQTGEVIAQQLGAVMHTRDDLRELNLGTLEGRTERELWNYFAEQAGAERGLSGMKDIEFPSGEKVSSFLTRVLMALADIGQRHDDSVLLVSHGVFTMVSLGMWLEPDVAQWPKYRVNNGSVSEVVFEPAPRLVRLNETNHLAGLS
jgi:2,3-bisphosphoglycerate-dependent phosphoglycerate mutase